MSTALRKPSRMTFDEYLAFEDAATTRHELIDGTVFAMSGGTDAHNLICTTLTILVGGPLQGVCQVFQGGMKLKVDHALGSDGYYPDLMVCRAPTDREKLFRREPILLIEVLSPTAERLDRGEKRLNYMQIASLQEYVLVAQDKPKVEVFRRSASWAAEDLYPGDTLALASVGLTVPLASIFQNITF
jgi:Uma2 family endonuclease